MLYQIQDASGHVGEWSCGKAYNQEDSVPTVETHFRGLSSEICADHRDRPFWGVCWLVLPHHTSFSVENIACDKLYDHSERLEAILSTVMTTSEHVKSCSIYVLPM